MTTFDYSIYDVFTENAFGGNQLAVLPDARGLTDQQMQQIAREFNYSESTFVLPAQQGGNFRVRIFTPAREMPFAGHPNIGTAIALLEAGLLKTDGAHASVSFEEIAGIVEVQLRMCANGIWEAELKAPAPFEAGEPLPLDKVAKALSLQVEDIRTSAHLPTLASVGTPFVFVELNDLATLQKAQANLDGFKALKQAGLLDMIHCYVRSEDEFDLRTRMFAPLAGVPEDPATGSANCTLAGWLTHLNPAPELDQSFRIAQGMEMGRPSLLVARARKEDGKVTDCWVAGSAVKFAEGTLGVN